MKRSIAGFPATVRPIELPGPAHETAPEPARERAADQEPRSETQHLDLWVVDQLDELIDTQALLNKDKVPDPPYWALVWIGARAVAARILKDPPPADAKVLDLGCGLGLSGVAAGRSGAFVLFADFVPACLEFAAASAELHGMTNFRAQAVDFTKDHLEERFDVILAADIVYEPDHYRSLADFLAEHLAPGGRIILTESLRADAKLFLQHMKETGFSISSTGTWVEEDGQRFRSWLHEIRQESEARSAS